MTMEVSCSKCRNKIESASINVAENTAYCLSCESLTPLSALLDSTAGKNFDARSPASGTTVEDLGHRWTISACHRSGLALFLIPFTLVWSGGSLSGVYGALFAEGEFDSNLLIFGLPFLLGSIALVIACLMNVFGRTLVSVENGKALIFIGIGSIGWYRRFDWSTVDRIIERTSEQYKYISLEGHKRRNLGWGLSSDKRSFVANFLRTKLQN